MSLIQYTPILGFVMVGVLLARRWVVCPPPKIKRYSRSIRVAVLVIVCWIGTFLMFGLMRRIGSYISDGAAYDEGAELPYEIMHDGTGDNAISLLFGWIAGLIFLAIASALRKKKPNKACQSIR